MSASLTSKDCNLLIAVCSEMKCDTAKVNWNNVANRINIKHGFHAKAGFKNLADKKLANGVTTLNAKEIALVTAAFQEMSDTSGINFNNVAQRINIKHGFHAKAALKKLVEKKLGGGSTAQPSGDNKANTKVADKIEDSSDDILSTPVTPSKKRSPKKKVGRRATPIKASVGGPKTPTKKLKKEKSPEFDEELLTESEPEMKEYISRFWPPSKYQEFDADEMQATISAQVLAEELAEASLMGVSVDEYRKLSADGLDRELKRTPTTGLYDNSHVSSAVSQITLDEK